MRLQIDASIITDSEVASPFRHVRAVDLRESYKQYRSVMRALQPPSEIYLMLLRKLGEYMSTKEETNHTWHWPVQTSSHPIKRILPEWALLLNIVTLCTHSLYLTRNKWKEKTFKVKNLSSLKWSGGRSVTHDIGIISTQETLWNITVTELD